MGRKNTAQQDADGLYQLFQDIRDYMKEVEARTNYTDPDNASFTLLQQKMFDKHGEGGVVALMMFMGGIVTLEYFSGNLSDKEFGMFRNQFGDIVKRLKTLKSTSGSIN